MNLIRHRAVVAVGVTVAVVIAAVAVAAGYAWERYLAAQAVIEEIEPRYARLLGLQGADGPLKKTVLDAYASLRRWAYPAEQDSGKAGNDVQQRARKAAEASGMNIVSSQVLPVRLENGVEQIPVSLTLEGGLQGLQMTLAALAADAPVLFVDTLSLRAIDRGDPKQPQLVSATMVVMSLRIQP
jgi:general secretion pathway protein M